MLTDKQKKTMLIIMDGWGINNNVSQSAIAKAKTPFVDSLYQQYSNTRLLTHGEYVGLPNHQMGNSEVGHMNIGAGRIIYQELLKINRAVADGSFENQKVLQETIAYCKQNDKALHLMGLVSDGGVHSHINHLLALCDILLKHNLTKVYIHCFLDGRDTAPTNGIKYLKILLNHIKNTSIKVASLCGRYYAMDRDKRWERIQKAYNLLVKGEGDVFENPIDAIQSSYDNGVTDEFILPKVMVENQQPIATIKNDDAVICFNFRTDRCREITEVLTQQDFPTYNMKALELYYTTMTVYDDAFVKVNSIYGKENISNTMGEVLSKNNKTQLRIAETEKYPHVSFFYSGGREDQFDGEERIMINSPKVATYDLQPEMSAFQVKDAVIQYIEEKQPDCIILNFANTDMVGHTGVFDAAVKAAETVDTCVEQVVKKALAYNYCIFVTADHGNADIMVNNDGSINTAHTKNVVPLFMIDNNLKPTLQPGILADIAPTMLKVMQIDIPNEMAGTVLF
ncbi:MAG: 2,3-bisphosphoglycerate-independent phosphoglycerate mutase [Chitinophagales bacterium]|nr:2,3-bisphosphoglycerate-independent phosphoglycerate mutase [Chitinophagales bacterium]